MKKLMIAACAIAFAGAVQATQYTWGIDDVNSAYATDPDGAAQGMAYLFVNQQGADDAWLYDVIAADITAGKFDIANYTALDSRALNDGYAALDNSPDMANYNGYDMFAVIVADKATDWDGTIVETMKNPYAYATDKLTISGASDVGAFPLDFGDQYDAGNWVAQGVPEPTSGLLLLLGVAGLALKRKHA